MLRGFAGHGRRRPRQGAGQRLRNDLGLYAEEYDVALRYADQHFRSKPGGIAFGTEDGQQQPSYRDFAYVAFTIGMTYQVSDTTLRDPQIRRSVLAHAVLSYVFGVVIVAGSVNLISGLFH
jgi:uncharacterized membrane protein